MSTESELALEHGIDQFNRREYYAAQEAWQTLWNEAVGAPREMLQGLIQLAAAFYKLQVGEPSGTVKLLEQALGRLDAGRDLAEGMGIKIAPLLESSRLWLEQARRLVQEQRSAYDPASLPRIHSRHLDA
jgi:predicted metal-dependent hydrolase